MAGSMNRLHDLLPRIIHELDEELPVGVLGLDNWGYITMGPDRNPDSMPSDGWGLYQGRALLPKTAGVAGSRARQVRSRRSAEGIGILIG